MDAYSTHVHVLDMLIKNDNIKNVFEFGCGNFSTILFSKHCNSVTAIEMQNESWYKKMKEEVGNNVTLLYQPGPTSAIETLDKMQKRFDLIFVDGHGDSRWKAINVASKYTDIIVAHDTETASYRWDLVSLDSNWTKIDYKEYNPWTSVWRKR